MSTAADQLYQDAQRANEAWERCCFRLAGAVSAYDLDELPEPIRELAQAEADALQAASDARRAWRDQLTRDGIAAATAIIRGETIDGLAVSGDRGAS